MPRVSHCATGASRSSMPRRVVAARRLGFPIHVWTVDDAALMERLLDVGVDGLLTDHPAILRDVLGHRGKWGPHASSAGP